MFCIKCSGMGEYRGNGMIMVTCPQCFGHGHNYDEEVMDDENELISGEIKIDRRSKSYREAIKKIRAINSDISYQEAVKMFEKEYKQI